LERLDAKHKQALGEALLLQLRRRPAPTYTFWSLTRLGARVLLYGPLNTIVHPHIAQGWLDQLLSFEPSNDSERFGWGFCLAQLARQTGQRGLDVDEPYRDKVLAALRKAHVPAEWSRMVAEVVAMESEERSQMFGEALPVGLRLAQAE